MGGCVMLSRFSIPTGIAAVGGFVIAIVAGCADSSRQGQEQSQTETASELQKPAHESSHDKSEKVSDSGTEEHHGHKPGAHGGIIVSLGRDSHHVEAIVTSTGELRLYTLANDESRVLDIEVQDLIAYVKPAGASDSTSVELKPQPQPGDAAGKSSLFVAKLPQDSIGKSVDVTVPNITIAGERFRLSFTTKIEAHGEEAVPQKISDEAERQLYLTPGGLYSQADIEANGNMTASQKFAGFKAAHDLQPKVGDKICPVTLTKANAKCTWTVGGKSYEFCCPPCVDEFVTLAKTRPEEIKEPEFFVKRESSTDTDKR